jgi:hypothetical protein
MSSFHTGSFRTVLPDAFGGGGCQRPGWSLLGRMSGNRPPVTRPPKALYALGSLIFVVRCCVFVNASAQDHNTLKVSVDLVNVQFSVTDRHGRFVPSLTAKDFLVEEDGRRQEIRNFARENELPLTLSMLVDTSPSVQPVFAEEKMTATRIFGENHAPQGFGARDRI